MKWMPASNLFLDLGIMAPGDPREAGIRTPAAHILTPETDRTTHYFWAAARDFEKENVALTERLVGIIGRAFNTEDKPVIEAAQRNIERTGAKLRNFTVGDRGSAQVRQELDRLVMAEDTAAAAEPAPV